MAPKVLVSDKLSETAVQIFRDRGIDVQRPLRRRLMPEASIWTQNRRKCANQHATSGSVV